MAGRKPVGEPSGSVNSADEPPTHDPADGAPLDMVHCAECGEELQGVQSANEHYYATHGKREDESTA